MCHDAGLAGPYAASNVGPSVTNDNDLNAQGGALAPSTSEYLHGEFRLDEDQMRDVEQKAEDALSTLEVFRDVGFWPYEITNGDHNLDFKPSLSTSSMNLFAIGIATGTLSSNTLTPSLIAERHLADAERSREWRQIIPNALKDVHNRRSAALAESEKEVGYPVACTSQTYGPNDPFTLLWLLELLNAYGASSKDGLDEWTDKVRKVAEIETERAFNDLTRASLRKYGALNHMFPLLRFIQIRKTLRESDSFSHAERTKLIKDVRDRLNAHLAYFAIRNSSYDAAELAFAMEALLILDKDAVEKPMVERWAKVLAESQQRTPYWRPLRPFIATEQGMVLLPLSVEIANSLIRSSHILDNRDDSTWHTFSTIELLRTYTEWLTSRIVRGRAGTENARFLGWHSEHADDPDKIHTWETSQVLIYLLQYRALVSKHRASKSLELMNLSVERLNATTNENSKNRNEEWKTRVDSFESMAGLNTSSPYAVYHRIDESFVAPRQPGAAAVPSYSMLLYGPQGTGKTTIAKNLAEALDFQFISISPSDFIVGGGTMVEAQAKAIFEVLSAQTSAVILLDEIDRLILDRETEVYEQQGDVFRFMTPSMLTKLQHLRDQNGPIFIIGTNYGESIDPAIKRAGRIDQQYLVLPPDLSARKRLILHQFRKLAKNVAFSEDDVADAADRLVLAVAGEIKMVVTSAVTPSGSSDDITQAEKPKILERLLEGTGIAKTITIEPYVKRLGPKAKFKPPIIEYLMLLHLLVEARAKEISQDELWDPARKVLQKERIDKQLLPHFLNDEDVASKLAPYLFHK